MHYELHDFRYRHASSRLSLKLLKLFHLFKKYAATQPRVPSGNPDGGHWTSGGQGEEAGDTVLTVANAGYSVGRLIAEIPLFGGGRNCVYQFDFASIVVPGPNYASCSPWVPSSAVTHGRFLNDNRKAFA